MEPGITNMKERLVAPLRSLEVKGVMRLRVTSRNLRSSWRDKITRM